MNDLIIKIYDGIFDTVPVIQEEEINSLTIKEDVNNIDIATIWISNEISWIRMGQKIEIYEVRWDIYESETTQNVYQNLEDLTMNLEDYTMNLEDVWLISSWTVSESKYINQKDNLLFQWFISKPIPWLKEMTLECKNQKSLMSQKIILENISFTNKTLKEIVDWVLSQWNTAYWENWTSDIAEWWAVFSKSFLEKDVFFNVFNELAKSQWFAWTIQDQKIVMKYIIWEDRSSWEDFMEIVYDNNEPQENNILDVKVDYFSTISNVVIWSDSSGNTTLDDQASIAIYWPLASAFSSRDWNLDVETQQYLDDRKVEQKMYTIDVEPLTINPNIWDRIHLRIENVSDYSDIIWDVIVNKKTTDFTNWWKKVTVWVSDIYVVEDSFVRKINTMKQTLDLLNIQ